MNPPLERRQHVRYLCSAVAEIHIKSGPASGACHIALIDDICAKGMRLSMDGAIEVGSEILITVPDQAEFIGAVRHVRQEGSEYTVGVEFTVGAWDERSAWPRHRWLPTKVQRFCMTCSGTKEAELSYATARG